jgi:hypothetical protein
LKFKTLYGKEKPVRNAYRLKIKWNGKSRSKFQKSVKKLLYPHWRHDLVFEEFKIPGSMLSIDFYNHTKRIAIEVQGAQHIRYIEHFHKSKSNFIRQIRRDCKKQEFCDINDIKLIEIYPDDELTDSYITSILEGVNNNDEE